MTTDIKLALAKGKVEGAKVLLKEELLRLDKQEFEAKLRAEYDELFPATREATDEEIQKDYEEFCIAFGAENVKYMYSPMELVKIDYSQDENYVTFEEYKNETRVVSEAIEATYDEDGMELTPYVPEVTELVRPYVPMEVTDEMIQIELDKLGYIPKDITEAKQYLADTDWYIVRFTETGTEVPQDVLDARAAARLIV